MSTYSVVSGGVLFTFDTDFSELVAMHNPPSYVFSELTSVAHTLRRTFNGEVNDVRVMLASFGKVSVHLQKQDGCSGYQYWLLQFRHTGMHLSQITYAAFEK